VRSKKSGFRWATRRPATNKKRRRMASHAAAIKNFAGRLDGGLNCQKIRKKD